MNEVKPQSVNEVTQTPAERAQCIAAAHTPNALHLVGLFMRIGGQTTGKFNPQQALLYLGLQCEELAEQLEVVAAGEVDHSNDFSLRQAILYLKEMSNRFKNGMHLGSLMRCDIGELLDGAHDLAWVAHGLAESISSDANASFREVARANLSKYPGGRVIRDEHGKIRKPEGWTGPDLSKWVPVKEG